RMRAQNPDVLLIAKANAGIPHFTGDELVYDGTPALMGEYARHVRDLGANLVGGCCGHTPEHLARMAEALARPAGSGEAGFVRAGVNPAPTGTASSPASRQRRHRRREG